MTAAITDFTQFAGLRHAADSNDPAAIREVAGQFEALFIQSVLKSMREASPGDPLFGDSHSHEMYRDLLDQQLAMEMAGGRGIGLAEMLVRQLGGDTAAKTPPERPFAITRTERAGAADRGPEWRDPESFATAIWPHAKRAAARLGVAPEGLLAQAALETGWGKHVMQRTNGDSSLNLFGIKAGLSWHGPSVTTTTLEFDGDVARREQARFRAYDSVAATFDDFAELIGRNPRYASVRGHGDDIDGFAGALQASGYATDPEYAAKIQRVAGSNTMRRVLAVLKNPADAPISR